MVRATQGVVRTIWHRRSLKDGEFDAAIVELDAGAAETAPPAGIAEAPLLDEPWKLVVPAGTLITDITDILDGTEHAPLPWLGEPEAATAYPARRLRRISGSNKPIVHRYFGTQTALGWVAAGEGMTVLPPLALRGTHRISESTTESVVPTLDGGARWRIHKQTIRAVRPPDPSADTGGRYGAELGNGRGLCDAAGRGDLGWGEFPTSRELTSSA